MMDTTRTIDSETLLQTAQRLERAGMVLDRATLSPTLRRALFAWQCRAASESERPEPRRTPIGFAYAKTR
jgi:hypothetical protein